MKKILISILLLVFPFILHAESLPIVLDKAPVNLHDTASIKRGAKFYATVCMACHTMIYMRYNKLAREAGVTYEKMPVNVQQWPNGVKPPDLSLITDVRGVDWVYTYLHSFYQDPARPSGVNNLLVPNTSMAGILVPLQGQQTKTTDLEASKRILSDEHQWYDVLVLTQKGSMTPQQFDATMTDLVNFLAYAAAPYKMQQQYIGLGVIIFLLILFFLAYQLKQAYWKTLRSTSHDETEQK